MAGKGFETGSRDQLDELQAQIEDLQAAVKRLENIKQPTVPIYQNFTVPNPGDLPDDPIEGQVAIGDDDIHRWYSNGAWHSAPAATALSSPQNKWTEVAANGFSGTVASGDGIAPVANAHTNPGFYDNTIYSYDAFNGWLSPIVSGLYLLLYEAYWYADWGRASVVLTPGDSNLVSQFELWGTQQGLYTATDVGGLSSDGTFWGGQADHTGLYIKNFSIVRYGHLQARTFRPMLINQSGSSRTFSGDGWMAMSAIQLRPVDIN